MRTAGTMTRYADQYTVNSLLKQLAHPTQTQHRWGLDDPIRGLRGIAADALQDNGRDDEAELLRQPNRHVLIRDGEVHPGRFTSYPAMNALYLASREIGALTNQGPYAFAEEYGWHDPNEHELGPDHGIPHGMIRQTVWRGRDVEPNNTLVPHHELPGRLAFEVENAAFDAFNTRVNDPDQPGYDEDLGLPSSVHQAIADLRNAPYEEIDTPPDPHYGSMMPPGWHGDQDHSSEDEPQNMQRYAAGDRKPRDYYRRPQSQNVPPGMHHKKVLGRSTYGNREVYTLIPSPRPMSDGRHVWMIADGQPEPIPDGTAATDLLGPEYAALSFGDYDLERNLFQSLSALDQIKHTRPDAPKVENPWDATAHLVLADWLDEQGYEDEKWGGPLSDDVRRVGRWVDQNRHMDPANRPPAPLGPDDIDHNATKLSRYKESPMPNQYRPTNYNPAVLAGMAARAAPSIMGMMGDSGGDEDDATAFARRVNYTPARTDRGYVPTPRPGEAAFGWGGLNLDGPVPGMFLQNPPNPDQPFYPGADDDFNLPPGQMPVTLNRRYARSGEPASSQAVRGYTAGGDNGDRRSRGTGDVHYGPPQTMSPSLAPVGGGVAQTIDTGGYDPQQHGPDEIQRRILEEIQRRRAGGTRQYARHQRTNYAQDPDTMRAELQGFRQALGANPMDPVTHEVMADWYEDNGDIQESTFRRKYADWLRANGDGAPRTPRPTAGILHGTHPIEEENALRHAQGLSTSPGFDPDVPPEVEMQAAQLLSQGDRDGAKAVIDAYLAGQRTQYLSRYANYGLSQYATEPKHAQVMQWQPGLLPPSSPERAKAQARQLGRPPLRISKPGGARPSAPPPARSSGSGTEFDWGGWTGNDGPMDAILLPDDEPETGTYPLADSSRGHAPDTYPVSSGKMPQGYPLARLSRYKMPEIEYGEDHYANCQYMLDALNGMGVAAQQGPTGYETEGGWEPEASDEQPDRDYWRRTR